MPSMTSPLSFCYGSVLALAKATQARFRLRRLDRIQICTSDVSF